MSASGPRHLATSADELFDVCVAGGGPAGSALALRLAQLGRRVAIAEKLAFPRPHVGESITAGALPLLDVLGVRGAIESAGFLRSEWATVAWAGEQRRYQPHGGPGLLVDRARFDALLLSAASALPGVVLHQPARVVRAEREGDHWAIALQTGETLRARYLAEASGRARLLPRTRRRLGAPTLALYAYFEGLEGDQGETWVEAGGSAWYWGSPVPGGRFNATVFVAPKRSTDHAALLSLSRLLGPRLRGARRSSEVFTCDATAFVEQSPVSSAFIKIGDAALSLDPLSSQGIETAIGTSLHAAVVLNTMMDRPEDSELAVEFYRGRIQRSADFHAAAAADFYRRQAAIDEDEFWGCRAATAQPPAARARLLPEAHVELAPRLQFAPVAVAGATHLERHDGVKLDRRDYAFVGDGLAIAPLLRELDGPTSAMEVVRRWSRRVPARQALAVLQWAVAEGLICPHR